MPSVVGLSYHGSAAHHRRDDRLPSGKRDASWVQGEGGRVHRVPAAQVGVT